MAESQDWQVAVADVFSKFHELTLPIGGVILYAGATAPEGWVFCDGSTLSAREYPALAEALQMNGTLHIPNLPAPAPAVHYIMRVGNPNQ